MYKYLFSFLSLSVCATQAAQAQAIITTVAGTIPGAAGFTGDGGPATAAKLKNPASMVKDAAGNIYIADAANFRVRKINTSGIISTVAGTGSPGYSGDGGAATAADILTVTGICIDAAGNLYIADQGNNRVRKVSAAGIITTVAGNGSVGDGGDGGAATAAQLNQPADVAIDASGRLYIADKANQRVRMVSSSGVISTVAGTPMAGYSGDGAAATLAELSSPMGVGVDAAGNLYIADHVNGRIRKVNTAGIITTVAGDGTLAYGGDGGPATAAQLYQPADVHVDAAGNMYIADMVNDRIRKVNAGGTITTIAGNGLSGFSGDGGPAIAAQLDGPAGVYADGGGNIYLADQTNNRVRVINTAGIINTVSGVSRYIGDGGPATNAELITPSYLAVDKSGNVYFSETNGHRIRKITPAGIISTFAGTGTEGPEYGTGVAIGDGGPATAANLNRPEAITIDTAGNVYFEEFARRIRKVTPAGIITTFCGTGNPGYAGDGGPGSLADISTQGLTVDTAGNFYLAESGYGRIRKLNSAGTITTIAGTGILGYSGDGGGATDAQLNYPYGMRTDTAGNLYVADQMNSSIRMITPAGDIFTVAGCGIAGYSGDGGPATAAELKYPQDVTVWKDKLIIADAWNARLRMVDADGNITTICGTGTPSHTGDGGPATAAGIWMPTGIDIGPDNNSIYFVDIGSATLRKISNLVTITPPTSVNAAWQSTTTRIFPNPVADEVRLYSNAVINYVYITDLLGRPVMEHKANSKNTAIDVKDLPPGTYLLRVNGSETLRFIKQ